jgi:hypothetical protein
VITPTAAEQRSGSKKTHGNTNDIDQVHGACNIGYKTKVYPFEYTFFFEMPVPLCFYEVFNEESS